MKTKNTPRTAGMGNQIRFLTAMLGLCALVCGASAQSFTTLKRFGDLNYVSGQSPHAPLVQGPDGTLYGTTRSGAQNVQGTVFKLQPDGSGFTVLKWFTNDLEATAPLGGLVLFGATLYGTTSSGGGSGVGTVFKVNTVGTGFNVLKEFSYSDGAAPGWALAMSGRVLYGTTTDGGNGFLGTVFKLNTNGTGFAVLKEFAGSDGAIPQSMTLSGNVLYGVTWAGGNTDNGTIFKMNTDGTGYSVLKHFTGPDGKRPVALALSGDVLYGSTEVGGSADLGTVFKLNTDGSGFSVLKEFSALVSDSLTNSDGAGPGPLVSSGGRLIGGTQWGGHSGNGVLFALNTDGTGFTVLKNFSYYAPNGTNSDGLHPRRADRDQRCYLRNDFGRWKLILRHAVQDQHRWHRIYGSQALPVQRRIPLCQVDVVRQRALRDDPLRARVQVEYRWHGFHTTCRGCYNCLRAHSLR